MSNRTIPQSACVTVVFLARDISSCSLQYLYRFVNAAAMVGSLIHRRIIVEIFAVRRGFLVRLLLAKGDYDAALVEIRARPIHSQGAYGFLAEALALSGQSEAARRELDRVLAQAQEQYVPAYDIAMSYAALKDPDNTLLWIGRAYEGRSTLMGSFGLEPTWIFFAMIRVSWTIFSDERCRMTLRALPRDRRSRDCR